MINVNKLNNIKRKFFMPTNKKIRYFQWTLHLAIIPAILFGTTYLWLSSLVMFWLIHGIGSGIGAHRYFTHRTFKTNKIWEVIMSFFFTLSCTGSTIGYVLMHQKHHSNSDKEGDPHNPNENGFFRTWLGLYNEKNLQFSPKRYTQLMKDNIMNFFHSYYFLIIFMYNLILFMINPLLNIFLFAIPAIGQFHANAILIVLAHTKGFGYRNYEVNDDSSNVWYLKPLLLGEELHNNHHYKPNSVTMNMTGKWYEFDPLYYVVKYIISTEKLEYSLNNI